MLEFLRQFAGRKSGGTAPDQMPNGGRQTAVLGKANVPVAPKAIAVKPGCASPRVPLAIMGVAAEIADLQEESAHRDERLIQSARQLG